MFSKKSLSIPLILIFSICLLTVNAIAGGCNGGENCLKCSQMDHPHAAGPDTGILPDGCQTGIPNNACGITVGRIFDSQDILISAVRVNNQEDSSINAVPAVDQNKDLFSGNTISLIFSKVVTSSPPIYLRNLSFRC